MHFEEKKIPRLQFLKPPTKHSPEKPGMVTPPLHTSATIPFVWEEKPGKPRPCTSLVSFSNSTTDKSLELPPRMLFDHANITKLPSPTTVLNGPYMNGSFSAEREQLVGTIVKDLKVKKHVFSSSVVDKGKEDHIGSTIRVSHKNVKMKRVKHCRSFITKPFHAKSLVWVSLFNTLFVHCSKLFFKLVLLPLEQLEPDIL